MNTYIYTIQASRVQMWTSGLTDAENASLKAHSAYLDTVEADGRIILTGTTDITDSRRTGYVYFEAEDDDAARAIMKADPCVQDRTFRGCVYPFRMSLWNADAGKLDDNQRFYFYRIHPVRPEMLTSDPEPIEAQTMGEHFAYLKQQTDDGVFCAVGPTLVLDYSNFGMGILRAESLDAAWAIGNNDPAVIKRVMRLDILPFKLFRFNADWSPSYA